MINIFISRGHQDEEWKDRLLSQVKKLGVENGDRQEKSFERTSKNLLDHFFFAIDHLKVSALIFPQENIAKKCPG